MCRWPEILLTLALFGEIGLTTSAEAGALYRCAAEEVRYLTADGRLGTYRDEGPAREALGAFIVDTDTGTVRTSTVASHWRILQQGGDVSDFVATPGLSERAAVTDFIRVRAWKSEPAVTFFRVGLTTITSGRCEVIR